MLKNPELHIQKWAVNIVFGLYWVFAFFFFNIFYGRMEQSMQSSLTFSFSFLFISFVCVDIHSRFITKPNLYRKKYLRFILFSLYIFITAFWLESVLSFVLNLYFWDFKDGRVLEESSRIRYQVGGVNMVVFGGVAIQFMAETFRLYRQKEEKEKLAVESTLKLKEVELSLLKSQVNPHFLFNSLNSIYGLSLEKSEQTPEVILQLSEILDYMLYKCDSNVLLGDEVRQIENYLAIQKVRFGDALNINYAAHLNHGINIAPLLILPLIENVFKHGKVGPENSVVVNINLGKEGLLRVKIENDINDAGELEKRNGGIGLLNLQRRLELLYPQRYALDVKKDAHQFCVNLQLELAD